jgi:hypothetical protein
MDTSQLEWLLFRHSNTKLKFGGVLARDELPLHARHKSYIINLDPSSLPGSHWVAVFFASNGSAEYFDSYGLPPPKDISSFLKNNSFKYICNGQQIQDIRTAVCGQYCAYFLLKRCNNNSMKQVLHPFSNVKFMFNDKLVLQYIKKIMRVYLPLMNPMFTKTKIRNK